MRRILPIIILILVLPGLIVACPRCNKKAQPRPTQIAAPGCGGCAPVTSICAPVWNPPAVVSPIYAPQPYCCDRPVIRQNCCSNCGFQYMAIPRVCQPNVYYYQKAPMYHQYRSCGVDVDYAPCERVHYRAYYRR
jgi:hypothetical protein